ncbi:hypothetical protein LTR08_006885 [Meristemomyces frigidus]|nr:hypothetical protein LTR08_006885 [Meristemomyces frigidus]
MELRRLALGHECLTALRPRPRARALRCASLLATTARRTTSARAHNERLRLSGRSATPTAHSPVGVLESLLVAARSASTVSGHALDALHTRVLDLANSALQPADGKLPEEPRVLYVLAQLEALARSLIDGKPAPAAAARPTDTRASGNEALTATSALLGSVNARTYPAFVSTAAVLNLISEKAEELLRHPPLFITPAILRHYVDLQTLLHQPTSFPAIFDLYAHKPHPAQPTPHGPITYTPAAPAKISAAVDATTATTALASATAAHNLPLAIAIITTTFARPSFRKHKILRQLALPLSTLALAPLAAYTLSAQFAAYQTTMAPAYATGVAFAGISTYIASVSSIGYVAITTANDQMERVTWAQGVPLWERWMREEERRACDVVAQAWGFAEVEKRGEEEGEGWEELREFVGVRGMVLDRAELMEGME